MCLWIRRVGVDDGSEGVDSGVLLSHETLGEDLVSGSVLAGMSNLAASTTMLGTCLSSAWSNGLVVGLCIGLEQPSASFLVPSPWSLFSLPWTLLWLWWSV
jgi:hypothetical protein